MCKNSFLLKPLAGLFINVLLIIRVKGIFLWLTSVWPLHPMTIPRCSGISQSFILFQILIKCICMLHILWVLKVLIDLCGFDFTYTLQIHWNKLVLIENIFYAWFFKWTLKSLLFLPWIALRPWTVGHRWGSALELWYRTRKLVVRRAPGTQRSAGWSCPSHWGLGWWIIGSVCLSQRLLPSTCRSFSHMSVSLSSNIPERVHPPTPHLSPMSFPQPKTLWWWMSIDRGMDKENAVYK